MKIQTKTLKTGIFYQRYIDGGLTLPPLEAEGLGFKLY